MHPIPIRRRSSLVELAGQWVALAVALSAVQGLLWVDVPELLAWPPNPAPWVELYEFVVGWLAVNLPIVLVLATVLPWLPQRRVWRWPLLGATVVAAAALGWWVGGVSCTCEIDPASSRMVAHDAFVAALLIAVLAEYRRSFLHAAESLHEAELDGLRLQSELAAGRLQLLQAQIEPHFLFNSLANVRRLMRIDGAAGRAMLADLLRYLESALPKLRDDQPTLAREAEVIHSFLSVHRVRMGARLTFDIDIPPELATRIVPPMMLMTLVENALKHGLQPQPDGGSIRIAARAEDATLRLDVADTGRGLGAGLGAGTGLANIRSRLRSMYGDAANLSLRINEPRGVVATIQVPLASR